MGSSQPQLWRQGWIGIRVLEPCNNIIQSGCWTVKQHPGPTILSHDKSSSTQNDLPISVWLAYANCSTYPGLYRGNHIH